ncbi:MAG: 16S rRNA (guanine(527)-N(7))-methyltransferase RsmG [Candidatus Acidiferrales bacterium]
MISTKTIRSEFERYDLAVTDGVCDRVRVYLDLLLRWNRKISLTAIEDPVEIVRLHFAESFLAAKIYDIRIGRLADVGSGAGFPGLALKIYAPELLITLIEPNSKKCAFLAEVARTVNLSAIEIVRGRFQDYQSAAAPFDFVASRALGQFADFLSWSRSALAPKGRVILWLSTAGASEVRSASSEWDWSEPYQIPGSKSRLILAGAPRS